MINIFSKTIKFEERENYVTWSDQELDASRNNAGDIVVEGSSHNVLFGGQKGSVDATYVSLDEPGGWSSMY
jgi:hypothetical protein